MIKIITFAALLLAGIVWALRRRPKVIAEAKKPIPATDQTPADSASTALLRTTFAALTELGLRGTMTKEAAGPTDSRIGGPLVWPKGETLPVDETGRAFVLLAQVDLGSLPARLDLPASGLLQVLITANEMFGCEFPSGQNAGMRVVIHPSDAEFAPCPGPIAGPDTSPIHIKDAKPEGNKITWDLIDCPPSGLDARLSDLIYPTPRASQAEEMATDAMIDAASVARGHYDIMLRGNPDFTQSDPREDPALAGMVNLIAFSSTGGAFMWGDCGEACFLIPAEDLPKADISRVIYYWDCC
jgi:uncharacterized protein YwqG